MSTLHLNVVSPERELFDGEVDYVRVPGALCPFEILPMHAPIITSLSAGEIIYGAGGEEIPIKVDGGLLELDDKGLITACIS